ncbi:MAG: hypothetical protein AUH33_00800 [Chloroflexi bacterium 13_1_40CM_68_21]|nr:MAG: hypothetical protein AUH33_00800 [Chloroflexi bacterium 13_1_40CM_68_21]
MSVATAGALAAALAVTSALLALYADPARRALLRERVRAAARAPVPDGDLDAMCAELFGFGPLQPLLDECVRARASILVSGATGSGKSTLLRSLAAAIPDDERLVVIEDTNELVLPHPHVVHLECVPGRDGAAIGIADLVANALRMRPDRILVGEVRTPREASALLEALSTGHEGSLTTLHAGSAAGALARLALLLARAGELGDAAIDRHVAQAIDIVVHVARDPSGARSIREIAAVEESGIASLWHAGGDEVRMPVRLASRLR